MHTNHWDELENRKIRRKRNSDYVRASKVGKPCTDCGVIYPFYVMDYDHTGEVEKTDTVTSLAANCRSLEVVQAEIDKCELVCSNCHRARTWFRKHPHLIGNDRSPNTLETP